MSDLRKEFKEKLPFWDEYHFEKSKVSEQVYAYIEWLENIVKKCSIPIVVVPEGTLCAAEKCTLPLYGDLNVCKHHFLNPEKA